MTGGDTRLAATSWRPCSRRPDTTPRWGRSAEIFREVFGEYHDPPRSKRAKLPPCTDAGSGTGHRGALRAVRAGLARGDGQDGRQDRQGGLQALRRTPPLSQRKRSSRQRRRARAAAPAASLPGGRGRPKTPTPLPIAPAFDPRSPPGPYAASAQYAAGERITHPQFGVGVVAGSPGSGKIDVVFPTGPRVLAAAKIASSLARPVAVAVPVADRPPHDGALV